MKKRPGMQGNVYPGIISPFHDIIQCIEVVFFVCCIYLGCGPLPVTVTTRIITFLIGNPYKPSLTTVTGRGPHPRYWYISKPLPFVLVGYVFLIAGDVGSCKQSTFDVINCFGTFALRGEIPLKG